MNTLADLERVGAPGAGGAREPLDCTECRVGPGAGSSCAQWAHDGSCNARGSGRKSCRHGVELSTCAGGRRFWDERLLSRRNSAHMNRRQTTERSRLAALACSRGGRADRLRDGAAARAAPAV